MAARYAALLARARYESSHPDYFFFYREFAYDIFEAFAACHFSLVDVTRIY